MTYSKTTQSIAVLISCAFLAGCSGSGSGTASGGGGGASAGGGSAGGGSAGGGGGSAGGGSLAAYQASFDTASQTAGPTQTRLTGTANYTGQVSVRTNANAANADEAVVGDLDMAINFDANSDPIDASVDNLQGEIDGTQTTISGTLSTANATNQVNAISATNVNIPGQGPVTITGISVGLEGTLSDPTGTLSGEALMTLQGNFVGTNGASVFGANGVGIRPSSGANIITGGTFYGNQD